MTTTTTRKLSPAQRDTLRNAIQRGGKVYCSHSMTKDILKEAEYIEQVLEVRDDASREDLESQRDIFVDDAKTLLACDNWRDARRSLDLAALRQAALDRKVWWITEAGRAAIGDAA